MRWLGEASLSEAVSCGRGRGTDWPAGTGRQGRRRQVQNE
jgi:hypothetical protein